MPTTTVLLCKEDAINQADLQTYYLNQLNELGIVQISILPLLYNTPKKVIAKTAKAYLEKLLVKTG